ncbi:serine/threonine-protein kinase [Streptomyces fagopyri]|uniref:serine/threonine-protein kinase n=1 Tax=Streptomyces fagopyri TaxID=2662397 RepID=UPI00380E6FC1
MLDQGAMPTGQGRVVSGRYRLLSSLGMGGMGTVWRAYDEVLHREVAVKEVRAPSELTATHVERLNARLEREAWAAARISHHNVVTVYDVAKDGGRPWIVMELVRGSSMADLLGSEGALTPRHAAHVAADVLAALRAAHAAGVLHRDVKPANVLLAHDGRVVLTDFGIATVEGTPALTMTGEMVGSAEFLAPERALGRQPGPASDLWSLGILLYAAVEGHSPFRQTTPLITLRAIVDDELPPARRAGPLGPVIEGLLRKDPAERLTAEQVHPMLRSIRAGAAAHVTDRTAYAAGSRATTAVVGGPVSPAPPQRRRRTAKVLGVGAVTLLLAGGGLTYKFSGGDAENSRTPAGPATPATVKVTVTGTYGYFKGSCPPGSVKSPTVTATFTVNRTPAQVSYRWVTERGSVTDTRWQTLTFADSDLTTRSRTVDFSTYYGDDSVRTLIGVEVREPTVTRSNKVPLIIECEDPGKSEG